MVKSLKFLKVEKSIFRSLLMNTLCWQLFLQMHPCFVGWTRYFRLLLEVRVSKKCSISKGKLFLRCGYDIHISLRYYIILYPPRLSVERAYFSFLCSTETKFEISLLENEDSNSSQENLIWLIFLFNTWVYLFAILCNIKIRRYFCFANRPVSRPTFSSLDIYEKKILI